MRMSAAVTALLEHLRDRPSSKGEKEQKRKEEGKEEVRRVLASLLFPIPYLVAILGRRKGERGKKRGGRREKLFAHKRSISLYAEFKKRLEKKEREREGGKETEERIS